MICFVQSWLLAQGIKLVLFFPGLRFRFPILFYDFCTTEIQEAESGQVALFSNFVPMPTTMWEMRCCNFRACCNFCCRCSSYHGHPFVQFFFAFLYTETVASSFMDWEDGWHLWNPQKRTFYFPDERIRSSSCSCKSTKRNLPRATVQMNHRSLTP